MGVTTVTGTDDLDARLAAAFGTVRAPETAPASGRDAVLGGLRRHRARRRRVAGLCAVLAAALGVSAYALTSAGTGGPATRSATSSGSGTPKAGISHRPATGCVTVRVDGAAAACAGGLVTPSAGSPTTPALKSVTSPGATAGSAPTSAFGPDVRAGTASGAARGGVASPVSVTLGATLTVTMPATPGYSWSLPQVAGSASGAPGAGGPGSAVLRETSHGVSPATGVWARFTAVGEGVAIVEATAQPTCAPGSGNCRAALAWQTTVDVTGGPASGQGGASP